MVLVTAAAYFAATFLGRKLKLNIRCVKLLIISQRFFPHTALLLLCVGRRNPHYPDGLAPVSPLGRTASEFTNGIAALELIEKMRKVLTKFPLDRQFHIIYEFATAAISAVPRLETMNDVPDDTSRMRRASCERLLCR